MSPTQVAKLVASSSTATLTAFISPYLADRALARSIHDAAKIPFVEVFVDAPLEEVEKRDPKGLYKKARAGIIKGASLVRGDYPHHGSEPDRAPPPPFYVIPQTSLVSRLLTRPRRSQRYTSRPPRSTSLAASRSSLPTWKQTTISR